MILPDYDTLTLEEIRTLLAATEAALEKRKIIDQAGAKIDAILARVKGAQGFQDGDAWAQPTGAHDAYPIGALVTFDGKTWENLTTANVWTPGVSGWREFAPPGSLPAWVQPTGSHDVYVMGAEVTHNGKNWRSNHAANVWEPGVAGTKGLWTEF